MADFKRKKGESFENFLRRFNKSIQASKKLMEFRKRQHVQPKITKIKQKTRALIGLELKSNREYLKKTGKLKDEGKKW